MTKWTIRRTFLFRLFLVLLIIAAVIVIIRELGRYIEIR